MSRNARDSDHKGNGRWLLLAAVFLIGGAGAGVYFGRDRISDQLHFWLASSGGGDIAAVPQPRGNNTAGTEPADLAEMPALVATNNGNAPASWPELGPADLLAQGKALADRALADTAFDQPPWRRFARPFTPPEGRPLLAILVSGLGTDRAVTAAAIAGLPPDISLSFDPYAADLTDWIAAARAFGHEALVDLPLQSKDKRDGGDLILLTGLNADETSRRIDAVADSAPAVFAFAASGGDALLLDDTTTAMLMSEIARLGLAFVDSSGEPMSQAATAATQAKVAAARSSVILDERPSRTAITERLAAAVNVAQEQGRALAVAKASPLTVTMLADWLRRLGDDAPVTTPVSFLLQR